MDFNKFLAQHKGQLISSGVPDRYWKNLHEKLENETFDAGLVFSLMQIVHEEAEEDGEPEKDGEEESLDVDEGSEEFQDHVSPPTWKVVVSDDDTVVTEDPKHIYLIDHAWTYRIREARWQLHQMAGLRERLVALTGVDPEGEREDMGERELLVEEILQSIWKYNQTYQMNDVAQDDDERLEPVWYVMDEFGAHIQHSDQPNIKMVPFYYVPQQAGYTLMWPLQNLEPRDEIVRDYAEGAKDTNVRRAKLLPWGEDELTDIDWHQVEPGEEYFKAYSQEETWPSPDQPVVNLTRDQAIKVFSDIHQVQVFLTHPAFQLVQDRDEADIWWLRDGFKDFRCLAEQNPPKFINQFPNEMIVTVKDPLAVVARRAAPERANDVDIELLETGPRWLPITYNLLLELPKFVSYYQTRQAKCFDNHWIVKPWNLARGLDTHITANLDQIIRLAESGPKVVCKYIENPVLFYREELAGWVKFDIRYIVMLASTSPLKLYAYKVFWLRFANKPYSLDQFDDYEKHFTVMNYQAEVPLRQVHYDEFIPMFEEQYPQHGWEKVEGMIFQAFRELFQAAVSKPGPFGLPASPQSRAIYAIDLMLSWDPREKDALEPKILEVNFCPDCERACKYHPHFYEDVFSTLFLGEIENRPVVLL